MRWVRVPNGKYRNASAELQKENLCHLIVFPKYILGTFIRLGKGTFLRLGKGTHPPEVWEGDQVKGVTNGLLPEVREGEPT